jgi:hypothetical protein
MNDCPFLRNILHSTMELCIGELTAGKVDKNKSLVRPRSRIMEVRMGLAQHRVIGFVNTVMYVLSDFKKAGHFLTSGISINCSRKIGLLLYPGVSSIMWLI